MLQCAAADDADLAHLPADQGRVRAGAAERGENAVGDLHAAEILGAGLAADQDQTRPWVVPCASCCSASASSAKNLILPVAAPGPALMPLASSLPSAMALLLGFGIEDRLQQLIQVVRRNAARPTGPLPSVISPSLDHVDGEAHGGEAGPLGVAGLQHPELALLDGELDVLHVAVVLFELVADVVELLVDRGHVLLQLGDLLGRADAGDDVFALGVDQVFAVEDRSRRWPGRG